MMLNYSKKQFFMIAIFSLLTFLSLPHLSFGQFNSVDLHSQVDRVQPMTGIVFWSENLGDLGTLGNKVQLEFSYLVYSDVIQNQGAYDWSRVDNLLADAASRGRQMIIRFRYTYPGKTIPSVPAYIRNSNDYNDANRIFSVEDSSTYIPDWNSQSLQVFTKEFFTAFAARYDNDSRLAFLQIGFGSYSEYHLYGYNGQAIADGLFPSKSYQIDFLNHVNGLFQQTQWGISIDAASSTYTPIGAVGLQSLNYGLFDDSFLHRKHSEYNKDSWLFFGTNKYETNVMGGEISYYDYDGPCYDNICYDALYPENDYTRALVDQVNGLNPNGPWGISFEDMSADYHISYMIGNDQLNYQSANRIESAGRAIGYNFKVEGYETNGSMTSVTIRNTGIAPIYYDAYPAIGGVRSNSSLKGLLPNQTQVFTISSAATGEDLTIACDRLSPGQVIQFDADIDASSGCQIGAICDDENPCTTGTTYDANCNCTGGTNTCGNQCITIDESLNDWSNIASLSSDSGFTLKAADDNNTLYISVSGTIGDFGNGYQIFLDTDNSGSEFTYYSRWAQTGFDAMVENGSFSRYTGSGSDWTWSAETSIISSKTTQGLELKIDKSLLNASLSNIRIGFASLSNWGGVAFVPAGSTAVAYTMSSALNCGGNCPDSDNDGVCDADDACPGMDDALIGTPCDDEDACTTGETYNNNCDCTGGTSQDADGDGVCAALDPDDNNPCIPNACNECIVIDQNLNDWSTIASLSSDSGFTLKAADDNNTLYISVSGTIGDFGNGYQIFLDTDNSGSEFTYFSRWAQTGFDAMIENGSFSRYTGSGSDWTWSAETSISSSKTTQGLELKIDKSLLNASLSNIRIGFASLSNWGGVAFVPNANNAVAYTMSSALNCDGACPDADGDGVCDADDICPAGDDNIDSDGDGIPDACDNCNTTGQACNDFDDCTAGETYDANCNCTGGTFQDSDNDGVCNANDTCPGMDDALIGTPCDDEDACTTGETYNNSCTCTGGTSQDADGDGVCAALDPNDNDPCVPNTCNNGACELLTNTNFDNDLNGWDYWGCSPTSVNGVVAITNIANEQEPWLAGFYMDNILVEQGESYTVKFRARADANRTIKVKVGQNGSPYTDYLYQTANLTTSMQNFTMSFTMNQPTDNNTAFDFFIAGNTANVYIDKVSLQKDDCAPECPQELTNTDFDSNLNAWYHWGCNTTPGNGIANITNIASASDYWNVGFVQSGVFVEQGETYEVTFRARANGNRPLEVRIGLDIDPYTDYHYEAVNLSSNWQVYNMSFTMNSSTDNNSSFGFYMGGNTTNTYIDNVSLKKANCGGQKQEAPTLSFTLLPNPAKDILNIEFENDIDQEGTAHIFTASGQLVNQQNIPSNIQNMNIPIDRLPAGVYIIRLQFDNGLYSTQRFVKLSN